MAIGLRRFDRQAVIDEWLARRLLAGWTPQAIVAASDGRVNLRTAYRWRQDICGLEEVTVSGYAATFATRRCKPPVRLSPWRRVV